MTLSIEDLEQDVWPEPIHKSPLVVNCHKLRKVPIGALSAEELRLLIGQNIGLPYIMPLAIDLLADNPWCRGTFFAGDLLLSVLKADASFWTLYPDLFMELKNIMNKLNMDIETYRDRLLPAWKHVHNGQQETK